MNHQKEQLNLVLIRVESFTSRFLDVFVFWQATHTHCNRTVDETDRDFQERERR